MDIIEKTSQNLVDNIDTENNNNNNNNSTETNNNNSNISLQDIFISNNDPISDNIEISNQLTISNSDSVVKFIDPISTTNASDIVHDLNHMDNFESYNLATINNNNDEEVDQSIEEIVSTSESTTNPNIIVPTGQTMMLAVQQSDGQVIVTNLEALVSHQIKNEQTHCQSMNDDNGNCHQQLPSAANSSSEITTATFSSNEPQNMIDVIKIDSNETDTIFIETGEDQDMNSQVIPLTMTSSTNEEQSSEAQNSPRTIETIMDPILTTSVETIIPNDSNVSTRKSSRLSKKRKSIVSSENNSRSKRMLNVFGEYVNEEYENQYDTNEVLTEDDGDEDYIGNGEQEDDLNDDYEEEEFDDVEYRPVSKRQLNNSTKSLKSKRPKRKTSLKTNYRSKRVMNKSSDSQVKLQADNMKLRELLLLSRKQRDVSKQLIDKLTLINRFLVDQMVELVSPTFQIGESRMDSLISLIQSRMNKTDSMAGNVTSKIPSTLVETIKQFKDTEKELEVLNSYLNDNTNVELLDDNTTKIENVLNKKTTVTTKPSTRSKRGRKPIKLETTAVEKAAKTSKKKPNSTSTVTKRSPKRKPTLGVVLPIADGNGDVNGDGDNDPNYDQVSNGTTGKSSLTYYHCPWSNCTYESKREWALNEHICLIHTGVKQFGCKVESCSMTFFGSSELDNHMKKCHTDVALKEFMPCTWPGCIALFKSKLGLRAHLQVHKGENLIPCDWPGCNYYGKNKRQSENHLRKHTGDRPFPCDYPGCDSKFRTNDSLRHHKKSHSEYRPFRCDWPGCEANFKTNRGLTIHRALHTGEKLFKCDWQNCEFASERKYHVDLHIFQEHTHVKPYQCTWAGCDASFLRNDKLQNHLKIHRQEKPFKCIHPACDKHFVEKGNMMKHYNNVHKR